MSDRARDSLRPETADSVVLWLVSVCAVLAVFASVARLA